MLTHPFFAEVTTNLEETVNANSSFSTLALLDILIFLAFILFVVTFGMWMSRKSKEGKESESYFLARRSLGWCLIGFSLIAANISTEQFVGMGGDAANYVGLAIASYEWLAAITLVCVAFFFLPQFLKTGIYTIPEFLEKRYNRFSRTLMSLLMVVTLVTVTFAVIVYSGAITFAALLKNVPLGSITLNWYIIAYLLGFIAVLYVGFGGLRACAWADLVQGAALIVGGGVILYFAIQQLGVVDPNTLTATTGITPELANQLSTQNGWDRFFALNADKLHMNLAWDDPKLPITALFIGLWIPNFYYWGLNQYIVQRTLGSQSLSQGQKGIVFAAFMKLLIPFIVVFPGIIAFNLYSGDLQLAATEPTENGKTLEKFNDQVKVADSQKSIFDFNADFAKLYPSQSEELIRHNCAVLNIPYSADIPVMDLQNQVLQTVKSANHSNTLDFWKKRFGMSKSEQAGTEEGNGNNGDIPPVSYAVEKTLIGYKYDTAFSLLIGKLIPPGLRGFILAAMFGAIVSSLASVLNASSTIFTMDFFKEYIAPKASDKTFVFVGRVCVVVFGAIGCTIALFLNHPRFGGIFSFIQEFQGFISPGILAAFLFGFFARYAPGMCGPVALITSPILYGLLMKFAPSIPFLDRLALTFGIIVAILGFLTAFFPRKEPFVAKGDTDIDVTPSKFARIVGIFVVIATIGLYLYFWKYDWGSFENYWLNLVANLLA